MSHKFKRRTYEILKVAAEGDTVSKTFDLFIMTLIILNVIVIVQLNLFFCMVLKQFIIGEFS